MWGPLEVCEECGSEDIRPVNSDDPSVGYYSEEWRCKRCGSNCEAWDPLPLRRPITLAVPIGIELVEPLNQLTLEERLAASIAVVNYRRKAEVA